MPSYDSIPENVMTQLTEFRDRRIPPGGFVRAVLENDLRNALLTADNDSHEAIYEIVMFCIWEIPAPAWGSPQRVNEWLNPTPVDEL